MALISIITINFNDASGLKKTIESVVNQSFQDFEFVVIDGKSVDESVDIIKQYPRINNWISEPDKGIYDAQSKGALKATGQYSLFLNSGDALADMDVLSRIAPYLQSGKSFYYGNLLLAINGAIENHLAPKEVDLDFMLNSTFWHPCVFIKTELFHKYGTYNPEFKICGDYEFFIRCLVKPGITCEYLNEFITLFDGNGISNNKSQEALQLSERELAWKLNVSDLVYDSLKQQNSFTRSKYASVINTIQRLRGKQGF